MIKCKLGFQSCLLLGLSAAMLLCSVQQQVTATPITTTTTDQQNKPLVNLPPIEEPGPLLPYEDPSSVAPEQKPSSVAPEQKPSSVAPEQKPSSVNPKLATLLVLKLSERRVYVYQKNKVLAKYPVAIGKAGWETPTGNFKVFYKQRNPAWQNPFTGKVISPGGENPLGVAWIGFWSDGRNQIGFHGTPQENLVGQAVSHGCVRMRNKDVTALFNQVEVGTPVKVKH